MAKLIKLGRALVILAWVITALLFFSATMEIINDARFMMENYASLNIHWGQLIFMWWCVFLLICVVTFRVTIPSWKWLGMKLKEQS